MLVPSQRKPWIVRAKSAGSDFSSHSDRKVRSGSALETTMSASISSPFSSVTPITRSPADADRRDRRVGADRRTRLGRRLGHRLRSPGPCHRRRTPTAGSRPPGHRTRGRAAGRTRCRRSTGPTRLSLIACQPSATFTMSLSNRSVEVVVGRRRQQPHRLGEAAAVLGARSGPAEQRVGPVAAMPHREVGRRQVHGRQQHLRQPAELCLEARRSAARVARREAADRFHRRAPGSSPSSSDVPSGSRFSDGPAGETRMPRSTSLRSRHTCGPQHRQHVGAGGRAKAGRELLGDAGAARRRAGVRARAAEAGPGQVEGGDQAVVAAADDDDVLCVGRSSPHPRAAQADSPRRQPTTTTIRSEMLVPVGPVVTRSPRRSSAAVESWRSSASSRSMPSSASAARRSCCRRSRRPPRCRRRSRRCR